MDTSIHDLVAGTCRRGRRSALKILWGTSSRIWVWVSMPCCYTT